jgi:hypothetical protein
MELTDSLKALFVHTAQSLQGSARRLFMARTVKELGPGGQRQAERALGWHRGTLRTGLHAWQSDLRCLDALAARGRTRAAHPLPRLRAAITAIVESPSPTAPPFRTARLSTRWSAAAVRRPLIAHKGSTAEALPTVQTSPSPRKALGDYPKKGAPSQPHKRSRKPTRASRR